MYCGCGVPTSDRAVRGFLGLLFSPTPRTVQGGGKRLCILALGPKSKFLNVCSLKKKEQNPNLVFLYL
jgi:hypothetical protein